MKDAAVFSVIMPTYNRADLIERAMNSVWKQDYRPIELIIVDDGSTDHTSEVVSAWQKDRSNKDFTLLYSVQENAGAGAARNTGIKHHSGQYVQFLDSDDIIHPQRFSKLVTAFEKNGTDYIQTGFENVDTNSEELIGIRYGRLKNTIYEQMLMGVLWPNTLRSALKSDLVKRIDPWRTDMICFEDRVYMEKAILEAKHPICIREVSATAYRHAGGNITDHLKTEEGRLNRLRCEAQIVEHFHKIPVDASYQKLFASRLLTLSLRCFAEGWKEFGQQCLELESQLNIKRNLKIKIKKLCLGSEPGRKFIIALYKLYTRKKRT